MKIQSIENYLIHKGNLNRKSSGQYEKPLYDFCEWLSAREGGKKVTGQVLQSVTPKTAQEYIIELKRKMATASVQKHRAIIKSYYNYLLMEGLIESNPMNGTQIPYDMQEKSKVKDVIKVDEMMLLVNQATSAQDKLKLALMGVMALRKTEVVNLRVSDVNIENMTIEFIRKGTGNKKQVLPVMNDVKDLMREHYAYAKSQGWTYIFESPVNKGKPISLMAVTKLFDKCKDNAGMSDRKVSPHKLRGCGITEVAKKKGLLVAKTLANHSSLATTQRYLQDSNLVEELAGL